jgi:hypothetical protein
MKLLVLSAPDVHELLGYDQCADAMRAASRDAGQWVEF